MTTPAEKPAPHESAMHYLTRLAELLASVEFTDAQGHRGDVNAAYEQVIATILAVRDAGRQVLLVGNGGSASIAGHTKMDLCNQIPVRATTFDDAPLLTSISNDHGYACAFERGIELWAVPGDCLIAVSSSGRSENILRAARAAKQRQVPVVTFTGFDPDNPLRQLGDWNFYVASRHYGEVEVAHHSLAHCLTDMAAAAARR
ncbi:MAG: SIS domain-containing protein [Planctomycetia bacterium]|nr:SIS domain-containing protein [Planctomycetia bacterium]